MSRRVAGTVLLVGITAVCLVSLAGRAFGQLPPPYGAGSVAWEGSCSENYGYTDCQAPLASAEAQCNDEGRIFQGNYVASGCEGTTCFGGGSSWTCYNRAASGWGDPTYFTASPDSILQGQSSLLSWSVISNTSGSSCTSPTFSVGSGSYQDYPALPGYGFGNWRFEDTTSVAPPVTTTYTITCENNLESFGCIPMYVGDPCDPGGSSTFYTTYSQTVTVAAPSSPDLTASGVTPTSATANQAATFYSTISNIGAASTGAGFTNLWQLDLDTDHTSVYTSLTSALGALAAGGSAQTNTSYTFGSAGTFYWRACADMNGSGVGSITESDEGNNCGAWTAFTVAPTTQCNDGVDNDTDTRIDAADAGCSDDTGGGGDGSESTDAPNATLTCTPSTCTVPTGQSVTLNYTCTNSSSATLSTFGSLSPVSSGTRSASAAGPYQLTCTGSGGPPASASRTVTLSNPTASITASPDRVQSGSTSSLTWTTSQCTNVSVTKNGAAFSTASSSTNVSSGVIVGQTTFTVSCDSGAATQSVIVNVLPSFEEF